MSVTPSIETLPLLPDFPPEQVLTYRDGQALCRDDFLCDILWLAERLPEGAHVLNLSHDRYWFAVGLFAAISRGALSLLPNSPAVEHLAAVCAGVPHLVCLGDQDVSPLAGVNYLRVGEAVPATGPRPEMPRIACEQRIACVFTSGSTGTPQPHFKTFGRMWLAIAAGAERLWDAAGGRCSVIGTVPLRHMYGLESSVLLPLWAGGRMSARTPFFPADVAAALAELPAPRLLVTTPFHLTKLLDADVEMPAVAALLSATAPLSPALAARAEERFGAPLLEIYGSTETGQLATRRPARQLDWQVLPGITMRQENGETFVSGGHLEAPQALNDHVEMLGPGEFSLLDRKADMINVVGKRTSLAMLNHLLARVPGVRDGVFCLPPAGRDDEARRLAAFVVAPGVSANEILSALRPQLDPVFLPRPIIFVDLIPRDGNGKVQAATLQALIKAHLGGDQAPAAVPLLFPVEHPMFPGHFPGRPIVPGVALLDAAQRAVESATGLTLAGLATAKFHRPALPAEAMRIEWSLEPAGVRFLIRSGEQKVADGRFLLAAKASA
ncbi:AMP-binding protein [Rhodocyclus tenuis]|uniref:Acyl-coenzyme A synthetase/AMP-(Fatty) acid ligase n=1 Tax=Rhodocyclus tenuis TaxID=1066 RepID=A0A840GC36_RHOTE|nr:AMP-binding protein [Rhodocyclus tenuis]MBB4245819.1 acyl-coenzyme A synthetase/AMP-(fatty) acid ligase [Rhodocyclus tenuis]